MAIVWTSELSVGVNQIDSQHKLLFAKADELFEAGKAGKPKDYLAEMLNYLDYYTKEHFKDEECYMHKIDYPDTKAHIILHQAFVEDLEKFKHDYQTNGGNIVLLINANQMLVDWLTNHISAADKNIGEYARSLKSK